MGFNGSKQVFIEINKIEARQIELKGCESYNKLKRNIFFGYAI